MICPQCQIEGKESTVIQFGGSTTCAYFHPFFDENGGRHVHDGNDTTVMYSCSNGHTWSEPGFNSCWCGWTSEKK